MKARVEIEWGSDALDGATVMAAQSQVFDTISLAMRNGVTEGGFQVAISSSAVPVEVKFRRTLLAPGTISAGSHAGEYPPDELQS